jgi:hypothetical protein
MLQRQFGHFNGRKLDHAKFKPLIFSVCGFALPYTTNITNWGSRSGGYEDFRPLGYNAV